MATTSKRYPAELTGRAVPMVTEIRSEYESQWAAIESVAQKLGIGTAHRSAKLDQPGRGRFRQPVRDVH